MLDELCSEEPQESVAFVPSSGNSCGVLIKGDDRLSLRRFRSDKHAGLLIEASKSEDANQADEDQIYSHDVVEEAWHDQNQYSRQQGDEWRNRRVAYGNGSSPGLRERRAHHEALRSD